MLNGVEEDVGEESGGWEVREENWEDRGNKMKYERGRR